MVANIEQEFCWSVCPKPSLKTSPLPAALIRRKNSRAVNIEVGALSLTPPVEYAADAPASVERSLLPRVEGVIKRLELGLDCL